MRISYHVTVVWHKKNSVFCLSLSFLLLLDLPLLLYDFLLFCLLLSSPFYLFISLPLFLCFSIFHYGNICFLCFKNIFCFLFLPSFFLYWECIVCRTLSCTERYTKIIRKEGRTLRSWLGQSINVMHWKPSLTLLSKLPGLTHLEKELGLEANFCSTAPLHHSGSLCRTNRWANQYSEMHFGHHEMKMTVKLVLTTITKTHILHYFSIFGRAFEKLNYYLIFNRNTHII